MIFLKKQIFVAVLLAVTLFVSCETDASNCLNVYFFNVGQGDAALAVSDDTAVLFDAGTNESAEKLAAYLTRLGIKKIDCMVLSHPHEDHIGGADTILERFEVGCIIMPESDSLDRCYIELVNAINAAECTVYSAREGNLYTFGLLTLNVLAPDEITGDTNLDSAIVKLSFGETSFLFTGDCEGKAEASLIEKSAEMLASDVLKVGHHGSNTATSSEFLDAVAPSVAVISCAEDNDYGHPHSDVLSRLSEREISVARTDLEKSVTVVSDGKSVWIKE